MLEIPRIIIKTSTPMDPETAAVVAAVATDKNFSNHMAFTHHFDHLRHERVSEETTTAMFDRHVAVKMPGVDMTSLYQPYITVNGFMYTIKLKFSKSDEN